MPNASRQLVIIAYLISVSAEILGQSAGMLNGVKRIFVDSMGSMSGMAEVKKDLIVRLKKQRLFEVVSSVDEADAVLTGEGEIWIRGYYSLNPRAGTAPIHGHPIYGGFLSVELKDKKGNTLWSNLATPHTTSSNIGRELSENVVRHLASAVAKARAAGTGVR
jgi:hypothetical protein